MSGPPGQTPQLAVRPTSASTTSSPSRPGTPNASLRAEMNAIMANLANLFAMEREGKLTAPQVVQLRSLITTQVRQITLRMTLKNQPNPLLTLPPHLDPTVASAGNNALISRDAFQGSIAYAEQEGRRILGSVIPMPELKQLLDVSPEKRNQDLSTDPVLRHRFHTSVLWYTKGGADSWVMGPRGALHIAPNQNAPSATAPKPAPSAAGAATSQTPARPPPPSSVTPAPRPPPPAPTATVSANMDPSLSRPPPPPPAPIVPPVPVEPEPVRRKRNLREWLAQEGPGMEFEIGVEDVWSEVIDSFVQECAQGSARLAKHRKSDKVGVKDMALFLDHTYGITVPGFNTQVPEKSHAAPEGKRRAVAPRAARLKEA